MKRFHFRLDPLLRVRRYELDRERRQLARLQAELTRALEELRASKEGVAAASGRLVERALGGISAGDFALEERALESGYRRLEEAEQRAQRGRERVGRQRQSVTSAHGRMRTLEILRERARAEYDAEVRRQEQKELDEIAGRLGASRSPDGDAGLAEGRS